MFSNLLRVYVIIALFSSVSLEQKEGITQTHTTLKLHLNELMFKAKKMDNLLGEKTSKLLTRILQNKDLDITHIGFYKNL